MPALAPIEVKILMCHGLTHKIATDSGSMVLRMPNASAIQNNIQNEV
ncbi:hypothetical protein [Flavobacterium sp. IMCC34518]|nr:hypothetical protein [Flavobacterium sp. IMCC34518]